MKVLTIQDETLVISERVWPVRSKCNYTHALPAYHRLFDDYNRKKGTEYDAFFWAFSNLRTSNLTDAIKRACEMCGKKQGKVYILEVPDELCLETDFYNFSDEIYAMQYPNEINSLWDSIYEKRDAERQVIIPYIDEHWVLLELVLKIED